MQKRRYEIKYLNIGLLICRPSSWKNMKKSKERFKVLIYHMSKCVLINLSTLEASQAKEE